MASSTATIVLLCVALALVLVIVICSAVYLANMNAQAKLVRCVREQGPLRPLGADSIAGTQDPPFANPTSVAYERVPFQSLPDTVTRTIVHERDPSLDLLQGFLSPEECKHLIALAEGRFRRSSVVDPKTGKDVEDKDRTSRSVYLESGEDDVVRRVEQRAAMATGVPLQNFERLQVVKYEPGQFYKAHFDYLDDSVPDVQTKGQRVVTIFAYLNDLAEDEPGGGTKFHAINKTVKPKLGTAALWYNMTKDPTTTSPKVNPATLHSGEPVTKSVKYGLNVWGRTKPQT
jgi:prolyl 4-hydroxylase